MAITWQNVGMPSFAGANQAFATGAEMITGGLDRASSVIAPNPEDQLKQQLLKAQIASEESQQLRTKAGMGIDKLRGQKAEYELSLLQKKEAQDSAYEQAFDAGMNNLVDLDNDPTKINKFIKRFDDTLTGAQRSTLRNQLLQASADTFSLAGTAEGAAIAAQEADDQKWLTAKTQEIDSMVSSKAVELGVDPMLLGATSTEDPMTTLDLNERLTNAGFSPEDTVNVQKRLQNEGVAINNDVLYYTMMKHADWAIGGQGIDEHPLFGDTLRTTAKQIKDIQSGDTGKALKKAQNNAQYAKNELQKTADARKAAWIKEGRDFIRNYHKGNPYKWNQVDAISKTPEIALLNKRLADMSK